MLDNKTSYKQIFKSTAFLGSFQVLNILISIIRSKIFAVYLGSFGVGILGILTSALNLVSGIVGMGIGTSAVKYIAISHNSNDKFKFAILVSVIRRLSFILGFVGFLFTIIFSNYLSVTNFKSSEFTYAFAIISFTILLSQLITGENIFLQGLQKYKSLSKAAFLASIISLIVTTPIYIYFKEESIAYGLLITSIITFVVTKFETSKISELNLPVSTNYDFFKESKEIFNLGFAIGINSVLAMAFSYFTRIYINEVGGLNDVGLYTAGFAILNTYVGVIFSAMGTDYFPRLSALVFDRTHFIDCINKQSEVALLILLPLILLLILFGDYLIIILYSSEFNSLIGMIRWASIGIIFKSTSWVLSYSLLAIGKSKMYFWSELVSSIYIYVFNIIGYYYYNLDGLGISFLIGLLIYTFQVYFLSKRYFDFKFSKSFKFLFVFQILVTSIVFVLMNINSNFSFICAIVLTIGSICFSIKKISKKYFI